MVSPVIHWCCSPGCGRWGAYGVGVKRGVVDEQGRVTGRWWCREHVPNADAAAPLPAVRASAPGAPPRASAQETFL